MKNLRGFTLAEVLICIAIIAVVSAFGGSIMKKSTTNAYKLYIRSGYENLYEVLSGIIEDTPDISTKDKLQNELKKAFNLNDDKLTKNGIKYEVTEANGNGCFIIEMTVPQQKTRNNKDGKSTAVFLFNRNGDAYLVPLNVPADASNPSKYITDLQDRMDFIPFYIDDGLVGKYNGHSMPTKIVPTDYKTAVCKSYGDLYVTVPNKYAVKIENKNSIWGETQNNQWDFNSGSRARIVNCTGIAKLNNSEELTVLPYFGR